MTERPHGEPHDGPVRLRRPPADLPAQVADESLDDLRAQIGQRQRMGGLGALAGMMPGLKGMKGAAEKAADGKALVHLEAMMSSMTAKERARPELINAKRKIRIAKGSGTTVQEVNKLLKMHQEMSSAMKKLKKMGGLGKLAARISATIRRHYFPE